ncbi:hypothetical protein [Streptomyces sp. NPDC003522]
MLLIECAPLVAGVFIALVITMVDDELTGRAVQSARGFPGQFRDARPAPPAPPKAAEVR